MNCTAEMGPSEIRSVFGKNLRLLLSDRNSISQVCRELEINRSQFSRYLNGEAFPNPNVLSRICHYFDVDARILLQPLNSFKPSLSANEKERPFRYHSEVSEFFNFEEEKDRALAMPIGFYLFYRRSFIRQDMYQMGLTMVYQKNGCKFIHGYGDREVAAFLGDRNGAKKLREYRGLIMGSERGVFFVCSRRNSASLAMTYLDKLDLFEKSFLFGYTCRTIALAGSAVATTKVIYERVEDTTHNILKAARSTGFKALEDLPEFFRPYLI